MASALKPGLSSADVVRRPVGAGATAMGAGALGGVASLLRSAAASDIRPPPGWPARKGKSAQINCFNGSYPPLPPLFLLLTVAALGTVVGLFGKVEAPVGGIPVGMPFEYCEKMLIFFLYLILV